MGDIRFIDVTSMLKAKPLETLNMEDSRGKCPRKRTRRSGVNYDESSDQDICHDFENDVLDTSRESVEVNDEISINPGLISEKVTRSPKDSHLKTEKWKYKTRKKRTKSQDSPKKERNCTKFYMEATNWIVLEILKTIQTRALRIIEGKNLLGKIKQLNVMFVVGKCCGVG